MPEPLSHRAGEPPADERKFNVAATQGTLILSGSPLGQIGCAGQLDATRPVGSRGGSCRPPLHQFDRRLRVRRGRMNDEFGVSAIAHGQVAERVLTQSSHQIPGGQEVQRLLRVEFGFVRVPEGAVVLDG